MKYYTIIGGVNGVGKSSFTGALKGTRTDLGTIVDVDQITAQLGGDPLTGGKESIRRINACMEKGVPFTQETTLSGYRTERTAKEALEAGYSVRLYYIGLDTAAESLSRIQNRVRRGGHNIPANDVERRFAGRWEAVARVLPYCDTAEFYDNDNGFVKVAEYRNGELLLLGEHRPAWVVELQAYLNGETDMRYADKYHLTPEQSRFLAKKKWDENVYCGMRMESRAVTFPQTRTILEGVNVPEVRLDDIQAILNMRDGWRFLMATMGEPVTLEYLCKLNEYIARNEALEWGKLRTGRIAISGTEYISPVPDREQTREALAQILDADTSATEKALTAFCWGARGQLFWDGNKRTSLVLANKILLEAGTGMLTITESYMARFNQELLDFYNSGNADPLKDYLYRHAIQGIDF